MNYKIPKSLLNPEPKKTKTISVRIDEDLDRTIDNIAKENNITRSEVIKVGIKSLLK